jgi:formylglycine-generating enzyme required for sulfatase activity
MTGKPRQFRFMIIAVGLMALGLLIYIALSSNWIRPLYTAGITEARLIRRGDAPAQIRLSAKDGMVQIHIAAGEFVMGSNNGPGAVQYPAHKVYLDSYWIDQVEVTNSMFAPCQKSGNCTPPAQYNNYYGKSQYDDYPVVYITWFDAAAFCGWEGGRLPTEAEWEKAARGVNQLRYPWGSAPPDKSLLNFNSEYKDLRPAYDFLAGASPYGLLNMAGNAREWVSDWFDPNYYLVSPYKNPQGPLTGESKSLRGGGDFDKANEVQTFYRDNHFPTSAGENRGFRCAEDTGN